MSTEVATTEVTASLDDLARRANEAHAGVLEAMGVGITKAIACGEALLAARKLIPYGEWLRWLAENFNGSQASGQQYMRLAYYKDQLQADDAPTNLKRAYLYIRGLPAIDKTAKLGRKPPAPPQVIEKAQEMREESKSYPEIATELGVGEAAVRGWLNPEAKARNNAERTRVYHERAAARRAREEEERIEAIRNLGDPFARALDCIHQTVEALTVAKDQAPAHGAKMSVLSALSYLHRAEDELARAAGVEGNHARSRTLKAATE